MDRNQYHSKHRLPDSFVNKSQCLHLCCGLAAAWSEPFPAVSVPSSPSFGLNQDQDSRNSRTELFMTNRARPHRELFITNWGCSSVRPPREISPKNKFLALCLCVHTLRCEEPKDYSPGRAEAVYELCGGGGVCHQARTSQSFSAVELCKTRRKKSVFFQQMLVYIQHICV